MVLDIDNACYGNLTLMTSNDEMFPNVFYVGGGGIFVSFKIGTQVLLSSGAKIGKLYCGEVEKVDVDNQTVTVGENTLKVSDFEYFARVGHYA